MTCHEIELSKNSKVLYLSYSNIANMTLDETFHIWYSFSAKMSDNMKNGYFVFPVGRYLRNAPFTWLYFFSPSLSKLDLVNKQETSNITGLTELEPWGLGEGGSWKFFLPEPRAQSQEGTIRGRGETDCRMAMCEIRGASCRDYWRYPELHLRHTISQALCPKSTLRRKRSDNLEPRCTDPILLNTRKRQISSIILHTL